MLDRLLAGVSPEVGRILGSALEKRELSERDASVLLSAEGVDFFALLRAADLARSDDNGDDVSFVVTRNINFTAMRPTPTITRSKCCSKRRATPWPAVRPSSASRAGSTPARITTTIATSCSR
jgi:hypothetical protein